MLEFLGGELVAIALVAFLECIAEGVHLRLLRRGLQQNVAACEKCVDANVLVFGTYHRQSVGEDQSVEVHGVAQDVGDDALADGGRHTFLFGQCRHVEVGCHDAAQSLVDEVLEWGQFHLIQPVHAVRELRQGSVRIGLGIAMTREMLADGQYASIFQATCIA